MEEKAGISVVWIPILQIGVLCLGTLISFVTAYLRSDITEYLPYISETGGWPPESCIFTLTIMIGSILGILVVVVRYLIVEDSSEERIVLVLNRKGVYVGAISWLGLLIVGAFPMSTVLSIHLIGAGLHFGLGLVYVFLQTVISHKLAPAGDKLQPKVKIRIGLCLLLLVFLVFLLILFPISQFNWKKKHGELHPAHKTPDHTGFDLLMASSFFEWALYAIFLTYFATFVSEFRNYRILTSVQNIATAKRSEESTWNQDRINYVT